MPQPIRLGIIGAGAFTTSRMLPNFQKLPDLHVTVVANSTPASSHRVADQFGIPEIAEDYRALVASPNVDAVLIGTPPYLHKEATLAALDAGKHVLCQTRIATTAAEAREMHQEAERAKARGVRTMLTPPAPFYRGGRLIDHLVQSGYLGRLRHVQGFNMNASMADPTTPLSAGRNRVGLYGRYNAAQLGLTWDVIARWTGHATRVLAQRAIFTPERPETPGGPMGRAFYPEEVTAIAETEGGAIAMNVLNWAAHFAESRIELYGDKGTAVYRLRGDVILTGLAGERELKETLIPAEHDNPWSAEEEFVRLIRGEIDEPSFSFWDGVKNMEYLEAVHRSAVEGGWAVVP